MSDFGAILANEMHKLRSASSLASAGARADVRDAVAASRLRMSVPRAPQPHPRGEEKEARIAEAKRRFRARALATHPDRGGSVESFRAAVNAFEREMAAVR